MGQRDLITFPPASASFLPFTAERAYSLPLSWAPRKPTQSAAETLSRVNPGALLPLWSQRTQKSQKELSESRTHRSPTLASCCGFRTPRCLGMLLHRDGIGSNEPRSHRDLHGNFPTLSQDPLRSPFLFHLPFSLTPKCRNPQARPGFRSVSLALCSMLSYNHPGA